MTLRIVYGIGLWVSLAATAMTIASIIEPQWLKYYVSLDDATPVTVSLGLHQRCSSVTGSCTDFPQYEDCHGRDSYFCGMWRSVGFLMSFAVVIELAVVVAYAVIILGGKQRREYGWKILCSLLGVAGLIQCASMAFVAYIFDHDVKFSESWSLDASWILCTVSWSLLVTSAAAIIGAVMYLPEEGGYELIPNENHGA